MSKICVITLLTFSLFVILPLSLNAQEDIENLQVGVETGTQLLADIPISHFEDADSWGSGMPIDQGIIFSMRRKGRPLEVAEIDPNDGTTSEYVLGVKVAYNKRVHAKLIVLDRSVAIVSSMNMNSSSTGGLSWEAGIVTKEDAVVEAVRDSILSLREKLDSEME